MLSSGVEFRIKDSAAPAANVTAPTVCLAAGITERGPIGVARLTTSFEQWKKIYGGYTLNNRAMITGVEQFYANGGTFLRTSRVTHCATPGDPSSTTSAAATLAIPSAASAPSAGFVETASQPFNLEPGWQLILAFDAGGDQTIGPVTATAASVESAAEPFVLADAMTIIINGITREIDTGEFVDIGNARAEEVKAILDPFLLANSIPAGALLTTGDTKVSLQSTQRGSGASFTLGGTMLAALGGTFAAGTITGTGNVANVDSVTAAEVAALAVVTNGTASAAGGKAKWTSATTGALSTAQIKNTSTAAMVSALGLDNAVHPGSSGAAVDTWQFDGKTDGAYPNDVETEVLAATSGDALSRNIRFVRAGVVLERWYNLSADPASPDYFVTRMNDAEAGSDLFAATDLTGSVDPYVVGLPPAIGTHGPFTGGDDGLVGLADSDFIGAKLAGPPVTATGIHVFALGEMSGDIIIVPGRGTSATHNGLITFCQETFEEKLFAILDPPQDQSPEQMVEYVTTTAALFDASRLAAIYSPEILVANPAPGVYGDGATIVAPPSGTVAGLCVRVDRAKIGGPFDHPAGPALPYLPRGVLGFATPTGEAWSKADRDLMFPKNINFISRELGTPIFVDGARTLAMSATFGSVGESRGVIFVRKQLGGALTRLRHRPITEQLLVEERNICVEFLNALTRNRAFASTDPQEAFFVDFGPELNTPSVARQRMTVGAIGLATAKPNEFIVVSLTEDTRALQAELAAAQA